MSPCWSAFSIPAASNPTVFASRESIVPERKSLMVSDARAFVCLPCLQITPNHNSRQMILSRDSSTIFNLYASVARLISSPIGTTPARSSSERLWNKTLGFPVRWHGYNSHDGGSHG
jgi:hypothetical protein